MKKKFPIQIRRRPKSNYTQKRRPYKKYNLAKWSWKDVLDEATALKKTNDTYLDIVSKKYGIIKKTLKCKLAKYESQSEPYNLTSKCGRGTSNKIFTEDQERNIADEIKTNFIDKHIPFDNSCLKISAKEKFTKINTNKLFEASNGWCTDFKKKWGLSSVKPSKKRKTNNDNRNEINNFLGECLKEFKRVGEKNFFNMDETFWHIINMMQTTFGHTGSESTQIYYLGNEKLGFTVILCISYDGALIDPIIIKKGKTEKCLTSLNVPDNMQKCYSTNCWVNNGIMKRLFENINGKCKGNDSVLILDQYPVHKTDFVKNEANRLNIKLIYIPSGLTSKYQPLDVGINGPLKSSARLLWKNDRMENLTKIPNLNDGVRHLSIALNKVIGRDLIINSFNKALSINTDTYMLDDWFDKLSVCFFE